MAKHEYYKISISLIPQNIIDKYNLMDKQINCFLYVRVEKGMYGLLQAGIIAHMALKENLRPFGYEPVPITLGLWRQKNNGITFILVVENFGIKYQRREDALHLIHALQ